MLMTFVEPSRVVAAQGLQRWGKKPGLLYSLSGQACSAEIMKVITALGMACAWPGVGGQDYRATSGVLSGMALPCKLIYPTCE